MDHIYIKYWVSFIFQNHRNGTYGEKKKWRKSLSHTHTHTHGKKFFFGILFENKKNDIISVSCLLFIFLVYTLHMSQTYIPELKRTTVFIFVLFWCSLQIFLSIVVLSLDFYIRTYNWWKFIKTNENRQVC